MPTAHNDTVAPAAKRSRPKKADFSDTAKRARGITPRDMDMEIKALKADIIEAAALSQRNAERVRDRIADAIRALENGERGDGMSILRALVRRMDGKLIAPNFTPPDEPRAA